MRRRSMLAKVPRIVSVDIGRFLMMRHEKERGVVGA
jgi:hypothetical protein